MWNGAEENQAHRRDPKRSGTTFIFGTPRRQYFYIYRAQSIRVTSLRESLYTSFMKIAMVEQTKDKGCFWTFFPLESQPCACFFSTIAHDWPDFQEQCLSNSVQLNFMKTMRQYIRYIKSEELKTM